MTTITEAHACAEKILTFMRELEDDDPVGPDEGLSEQEVFLARKFAAALFSVLDDATRRVRRSNSSGFTLIEVLVSTTLAMAVVGALSVVLLHSAKLATTLAKSAQEEAQARSRLARQLVNLDADIEGVTVTLDASTPEDAPCRLYLISTQANSRTLTQYASRGCANQP